MYLPKADDEVISLARLNMHVYRNKLYFIKNDEVLIEPIDQWLICNENLKFEMISGYNKDNMYFAYEKLDLNKRKIVRTDLLTVHFPEMKKWRIFNDEETV